MARSRGSVMSEQVTEVCSDAERMFLAQATDKAARE